MNAATRFELPAWECLTLLRSQAVGRLVVVDDGTPIALPVSYRLDGGEADPQIVVRTSPTGLLGRYGGPASFEVDHIDARAGRAWSVIARGELRHLDGPHQHPDPRPWLDDRWHWLVIDVAALSGRRFEGHPASGSDWVDWEFQGP